MPFWMHWPCRTSQFRLIMDVLAPFNPDCFMFCHSFPWEQLDKSGCWQFSGCLLYAVRQRWETAEEKHTSYRRWPGFGSSCERKPNYSLSVLECFLLAANKSIYRPNSILFCPRFFFSLPLDFTIYVRLKMFRSFCEPHDATACPLF